MLVLLLTVCALRAPADCREVRLAMAEDVTPFACMMQSPPYVARWGDEHPGERVARWRCLPADRIDRGA